MKNLKKIIALTAAAASISISCTHAMDICDPQTMQYDLAELTSTTANPSEGRWYWENATFNLIDSYGVGTEKDEAGNIINNDTFDGKTSYIHFAEKPEADPYSKYSWCYFGPTLGNSLATKTGTNGIYTLRYPNVGKERVELVFRFNNTDDYIRMQASDGGLNVPFAFRIPVLMNDGNVKYCGLTTVAEHGNIKDLLAASDGLSGDAVSSPSGASKFYFTAGDWYRVVFEVDVVNEKFVASVYTIQGGKDIFKFSYSDTISDMYASLRGIQVLFGSSVAFDIGAVNITCDTFAVKDVKIYEENSKLTASMEIGNNAIGDSYYQWDNKPTRQISPYLIVAQYDKDDRFINSNCYRIDGVTPLKQQGYIFLDPAMTEAPAGNTSLAVTMKDFYKPVSVSIDKSDDFAYAKVFVWNNGIKPAPYATVIKEENPVITESAPAE